LFCKLWLVQFHRETMAAKRLLLAAAMTPSTAALAISSMKAVDSEGSFVDAPLWAFFAAEEQAHVGLLGLPLWAVGVLICIGGTGLTSLGLVLQKFSHATNEKRKVPVVFYTQLWWVLGFTFFLAGQIINVAAMAMAPQAMLSCLGATALIFNAILAWSILGEHLHLFEGFAMIGIAIGTIIVIFNTPSSAAHVSEGMASHAAGVAEITGPLFKTSFLVLSAAIFAMLLGFGVFVTHINPDLIPIFWTVCAAISSGFSVTCFKCTSFLILAWERAEPWLHWQLYAVVSFALILCVAQLWMVNMALQSGRAMTVVPTLFAFNMLAQMGICEAAYHEMAGIKSVEAVFFAGGVVVILLCVVAMVQGKIEEEPEEGTASEKSAQFLKMEENLDNDSLTVPLIKERGVSTPGRSRAWSADDLSMDCAALRRKSSWDDFDDSRTHSEKYAKLVQGASTLDVDSYKASFGGRARFYSVSLAGPPGIA